MKSRRVTKDEQFLIKLREMALARGGELLEIDRYEVGRAIGLNDLGIDTLSRHLLQTNFVKKGKENSLYLTPNGLFLIEELLG